MFKAIPNISLDSQPQQCFHQDLIIRLMKDFHFHRFLGNPNISLDRKQHLCVLMSLCYISIEMIGI